MKRGVGVVAGLALFLLLCYSATLLIGLTLLESDLEQDERLEEEIRRQHRYLHLRDVKPNEISRGRLSFCAPQPASTARSKTIRGLHPCNSSTTHSQLGSVTVVVGALEFLGARLVSKLASKGKEVMALSSQQRVLMHSGSSSSEEMMWYRAEQLQTHHKITVEIANLTNQTQTRRILRRDESTKSLSELVFLPPGVGEGGQSIEEGLLAISMGQALAEFVTILEELKAFSPCTRVVLISHKKQLRNSATHNNSNNNNNNNNNMAMFSAWLDSFELILSTYHNVYHTPISILRVGNDIHGPWGQAALTAHQIVLGPDSPTTTIRDTTASKYCWYVKDVLTSVLHIMQDPGTCVISELEDCPYSKSDSNLAIVPVRDENERSLFDKGVADLEVSIRWAASYLQDREVSAKSTNNLVFTSYFTSTADPQRKGRTHSPNRFQYMANFYRSLVARGLSAVVFHDGLDTGFQHRVSSHYPNLTFSRVDTLSNRTTNDARFYAYYKYLFSHPEIDRILLTDISDVEFQRDPFELMTLLGDWLYVGTDIDIFPTMRDMPWIEERLRNCFGNYSVESGELSRLQEMDTVYNAGTIGGSRHTVLSALTAILAYLDTTPQSLNCNMPAVNFAMHRHFFERIFTGFPLTSRFLRHQNAPRGVYLVHK